MQFLKIGAVEAMIGLKKSEIYKRISRGDFPEPIHLGRKSSVWVDEEVEAWMAKQVAARGAGGAGRAGAGDGA